MIQHFSPIKRSLTPLLTLCLAVAGVTPAASQESPEASFGETVDVRVVNVEVFVTDEKGNPITGLTTEDFRLLVDGEPVPITNFYAEVGRLATGSVVAVPRRLDAPEPPPSAETPPEQQLHLTVLVDNGHIRPANRERVFEHLDRFLTTKLPEGARVSVVSFDEELHFHSDFLTDHGVLEKVLDDVENAPQRAVAAELTRRQILRQITRTEMFGRDTETAFFGDPLLAQIRAYAEEEYSRSLLTLNALGGLLDSLAGVPGRKALLYVADGIPMTPGEDIFTAWADEFGDFNSDFQRDVGRYTLLEQFRELTRRANRSGVTIYTLDAEGDHTARLRSAATEGRVDSTVLSIFEANYRDPQELVARETGGQRLQASPSLGEDLDKIAVDFHTFYSLGFEPEAGYEEGYHSIRVEVPDLKGVRVRHRDRWSPKTVDERMADATVATLLYGTGSNSLAVTVATGKAQRRDDGNLLLPVELTVPLEEVALLPEGETHAGQLSIFVSTRDRQGLPRPVQKIPFHLRIPSEKIEQARQQAAGYTLPLLVRPGDRQVAIGIRDDVTRTTSTLRLELDKLLEEGTSGR